VRLDDPARPVTFALSHPLVSMNGSAQTGGESSAALAIAVPALAPFAAIAGADLKGHTTVNANITTHGRATRVEVDGIVGVTGGRAPVPALIGDNANIGMTATFEGDDISIERAQLDGRTLRASANGSSKHGALDLTWKVALSNLAVLASAASGQIEAQGRVRGARDNLELVADATGDVATAGFPRGPIKLSARLQGLPAAPAGRIDAQGRVSGSPLELAVALQRGRDGSLRSTIERADWKSAHAEGDVSLRAGDRLPQGKISMRIARLEDLQPWIGQPVQGRVTTNVDFMQSAGRAQAKIQLDARNVGAAGTQVEHLTLAGRIDDPTTHPHVALQLAADGIASNGITGMARVDAQGFQDALTLKVMSDLHKVGGGDARVTTTGVLNATTAQLSVSALQAQYKGETAQLLAPVRVSFRDGLAVDRLRVGVQHAVLEIAGRVSPTFDVKASLRNVTPALAKTFMPDLEADGTMTLDARLTGTTAEPRGTVRVNATGLRMRTGAARTLSAANLVATADLNGRSARVDARLVGGTQIRLAATGQVPLSAAGPIDVHANGTIDAAIANPIIEAGGRRVKGQVTLDVAVTGTVSAPQIKGNLRLAGGDIQDYALGAHLTNVDASIQANGDTLRIASMSARAGPGTVEASGTFGMLARGRPVDVKLTARNAQPLASDLVTANMDADLTLRGQSQTRLDAAGKIKINHADITIPNALPPTVAALDVRRPGQKRPAPSAGPIAVIGLDLAIDAPRAIFVRGRGLDAEVGGELHVRGTSAAPQISGGLDMRRGTFDLAGTSLKFTSGKVSFTGTGLTQKIDPTLDFAAETASGGITAKLGVAGYADAPKITLTSTPELPQDEVLARLLFGVSIKELTPLQIAQIGAALATLSGVGGGGVNPLMAAQKSLGLDRLSVGGTSTGGASVEAGRYVSERVYLGAKQTTSGATQAQVQVDLTKHFKLQATLGTGGTAQGATPENDPGSSIGLSYQFEY
jgi:translocation and assembly module TamB